MMKFAYLGSLLLVIMLLALCDYRYKLAFFYQWRRSLKTLSTAFLVFLLWDIAGVALGIFFAGDSKYTLHVMILPKIPVEELLFLSLFVYVTLLLWRGYAHIRTT